ncbi:MAG TPA: nuclear transport factor 2 family protein [Candidatus Thermoplasmatota archaeon]|jgi:ketosteroid isomerase-like protein|nr:nuclear transport factor 2 family protein [Candidatus Thermoplasmatota archaeon]
MPKSDPAITKAIEARHAEWTQLFNGKQYGRIAETYYAPDGRLMGPNMPIVEGRANIGKTLEQLGQVFSDAKVTTKAVWPAGDLVVTQGVYRAKVRTASGSEYNDTGKFLEVFRQEHGLWLSFYDMFSSDLEHQA